MTFSNFTKQFYKNNFTKAILRKQKLQNNHHHLPIHRFPGQIGHRSGTTRERQAPHPAQQHPRGHRPLESGETQEREAIAQTSPRGAQQGQQQQQGAQTYRGNRAPLPAEDRAEPLRGQAECAGYDESQRKQRRDSVRDAQPARQLRPRAERNPRK